MPPPRPEDVDESSDSSGSEDSEAAPTPAPQPAAPVTGAAASARAAALAEQLAAQLAVTTASPASPAPRPKETPAAKEATELEPLILEAEAQDLVVIGNANCGAWIGKAIAESALELFMPRVLAMYFCLSLLHLPNSLHMHTSI